jgi:hypothetical protein
MNGNRYKKASARRVLAVLVTGLLGLAASPAALAMDRGGPGQPGTQQSAYYAMPVLPTKFVPNRFVSWSD